MAQITYPYNPYNDNANCRVTESFTLTQQRNVYYPRAAPFFFNDLEVYANATINADGTITGTKINAGSQFAASNPFDLFIRKYNLNVFSGIVIPVPNNGQYVVRYNTVGGKFNLDEAAYATLVANLLNHDREAYWEDLVNVPTEWPPEPHEHPVNLVYSVQDMMVALRQLISIRTSDPNTVLALLRQHMEAQLDAAHEADASMVGLGNIDNFPTATVQDLTGSDPNKFITVGVLMEALKLLTNGDLKLT